MFDDEDQMKAILARAMSALGATFKAGAAHPLGPKYDQAVPGALLAFSPFPVPEKMFESASGVAEGVTGMWPLYGSFDDAHHSVVVVSSSSGTRALTVDGGVFSDVTDTLALASSAETLAAGNVGLGDWAAQVTATEVRVFHLHALEEGLLRWQRS